MTKLVIVESPAKEKTISKYLGKEYSVKASVGHIRDIPKSNKKAIDIPAGFVPHYEIVKGKEKVISEIKRLADKSDQVLLATDPDREGEAIAWHVAQATGLKDSKIKRIVFNEITEEAIKEALKNPRQIDRNLKTAQEARRVLDRLFGYDLSGLIWKKIRYGLSAGRVQSPALRILMEREKEIRAFNPQKFWVITAQTETEKKQKIIFTCSKEPTEEKEMEQILKIGKKSTWKISDIKETKVKRQPRSPFITSTLQQTASSRLGYSPSKTMSVAQRLYESGLITYMRTDSTNLSATALKQIYAFIEKEYGEKYLHPRVFKKRSKSAQEAHEAIRPTNINKKLAGHSEDQKRLYRLIWQRTVACQMSEAELLRTKIIATTGNEKIPGFYTNGSRILFDGWLKADSDSKSEDVLLPKVTIGENLSLINIDSEQKETQPPPRYTEAGLIKELEKRGIGRPSTYASTMKTLDERGYVIKENKSLTPTDTGEVVNNFLEENFSKYISDSFTAEMEDDLDEIAEGKREYVKTLKEFYTPFLKEIKSKESMAKATDLGEADKKYKCPECGGPMIIKLGKAGKFLSCKRFPDCKGARTINGEELEGPKETGEVCPECQKGKLVERDGKYGRFISCDRYPKCRYIKKDKELEKRASTGVKCPICKEGEMTEKRGKFGVFYACTNYPKCKYTIKAKPTGNICPDCGSLEMVGTKTIPERCSNNKCPNHRPDKLSK